MAWLPDKTGGKQTPDPYARHLSSLEVEHREKQTKKKTTNQEAARHVFSKCKVVTWKEEQFGCLVALILTLE